jgi:general secretion pathway protein L
MDLWTTTANKFWTWINAVALYIAAMPWQFTSPRTLKLVEVAAGEFAVEGELAHVDVLPNRIYLGEGQTNAHVEYSPTLLRGTRIELILNSDHFLFRPLELPSRAAEFLDGIIKSQIDKLTPWRASDAAFGWTKTDGAEPDRILVTVAAAAQSFVESYIDAVSRLGVQSIAAFTTCVENGSKEPARIKIAEERFIAYFDVDRIRRILIAILVASLSSAAVAVTAATLIGISLDSQDYEIAAKITSLRGAGGLNGGGSSSLLAARLTVEDRKHAILPSVIVLEALSRILPDNTYLTELHVEQNKVQLVGMTRDAPSLIRLIEQSGHFARATFFAPTTQSSDQTGENFHIEAIAELPRAPHS